MNVRLTNLTHFNLSMKKSHIILQFMVLFIITLTQKLIAHNPIVKFCIQILTNIIKITLHLCRVIKFQFYKSTNTWHSHNHKYTSSKVYTSNCEEICNWIEINIQFCQYYLPPITTKIQLPQTEGHFLLKEHNLPIN